MQSVRQDESQSQYPLSRAESNPQLDATTKRLMLSAHLSLVAKKLRRGLCVEEREILELLPFTVANGWQPKPETFEEYNAAAGIDSSDEEWAHRLAEVSAAR